MRRLKGKRAIVTGAGGGIGRASAVLFAQQGARVIAVDIDEPGLCETCRLITADGGTAIGMSADAGSERDVPRFVARCLSDFGGVDILFANAGISGKIGPLDVQTVPIWNEVLRVNLLGPFLAAREVAPHMLERRSGSIICTASVAGLAANAGPIPYSASKAGVVSLVQTLANEFYGSGVRVNAICPGLIETGITKPLFDDARARGKEDKIGQLNPLARPGRPEEIAALALFLASDESSYVNGQAIAADGGLSSTVPFTPRHRWF
jgi:NAD(P)-dependent dehydrogenase (short-subunit alcohol dehydrogenase family)